MDGVGANSRESAAISRLSRTEWCECRGKVGTCDFPKNSCGGASSSTHNDAKEEFLKKLERARNDAAEEAADAVRKNKADFDRLQDQGRQLSEDARRLEEERQKQMDQNLAAQRAEEARQKAAAEQRRNQQGQENTAYVPAGCLRPDYYRQCVQSSSVCMKAYFAAPGKDTPGSPGAHEMCCDIGACREGEAPQD